MTQLDRLMPTAAGYMARSGSDIPDDFPIPPLLDAPCQSWSTSNTVLTSLVCPMSAPTPEGLWPTFEKLYLKPALGDLANITLPVYVAGVGFSLGNNMARYRPLDFTANFELEADNLAKAVIDTIDDYASQPVPDLATVGVLLHMSHSSVPLAGQLLFPRAAQSRTKQGQWLAGPLSGVRKGVVDLEFLFSDGYCVTDLVHPSIAGYLAVGRRFANKIEGLDSLIRIH